MLGPLEPHQGGHRTGLVDRSFPALRPGPMALTEETCVGLQEWQKVIGDRFHVHYVSSDALPTKGGALVLSP